MKHVKETQAREDDFFANFEQLPDSAEKRSYNLVGLALIIFSILFNVFLLWSIASFLFSN